MGEREIRFLLAPHYLWESGELWPCPHLDSTVDLTLLVWARVSQALRS